MLLDAEREPSRHGGVEVIVAFHLGIVLGLMMSFDLGGAVNKAAYALATKQFRRAG